MGSAAASGAQVQEVTPLKAALGLPDGHKRVLRVSADAGQELTPHCCRLPVETVGRLLKLSEL